MKKIFMRLAALFWPLVIGACATAPITGRQQLKLVPDTALVVQSASSYRAVVAEGPLSGNRQQTEQVQRVGQRIASAVETYFQMKNQAHLADGFQWEFNLIDKNIPNAWCMPGGKVAFYTGILPFTQDETGIAVVMGHEIAHAVAGHSAERVSHQILQTAGGHVLSYLSSEKEYHAALMQLYGVGSTVAGILPYSRVHESEADRLGLVFMAMAGYDPRAAIAFWSRMAASNSSAPPEFLSTHPSDAARIRKLREWMPEALEYYHPQ